MNAVAEDPALAAGATPLREALSVPLVALRPNPWNRKHDPKLLAELTEDVKLRGVMQPIVMRAIPGARSPEPQFEIIFGERRFKASQAAGLTSIPALLKTMTDIEVVEVMLVENLQREKLHELDEAESYDRLLRKKDGLQGFATADALARSINKSRSYVMKRLKLLALSDKVKAAFREGPLPYSHALLIARIPKAEDQLTALHDMLHGFGGNMMSQRDAEAYVQRRYMLDLSGAVFKITDATLVPAAGSCRDCSKRTGSNPDLFDDVKKGDTCTDSACFQSKVAAHADRQRAEAEAAGQKVLTAAEAKKSKDPLVPLDEHDSRLGDKPLRKLLGKDAPQVTMVEDTRSGTLVPMVSEKAAKAILKSKGITTKPSHTAAASNSERERANRAKAETAWRQAVALECVDKAGAADADPIFRSQLLWMVAARFWHELNHDARQRLHKLMGWPPLRDRWQTGPGVTADDHIAELTADELARLFTGMVVVNEIHVATYHDPNAKPQELLRLAQRLGVDHKATRERLRDVKRAEPAGKAAAKAREKAAEVTPETALAGALKAAAQKKVLPRYRDPKTGDTWSGRGLQPKWLRAQLLAGKKLADFDLASAPPKAFISDAAAAGLAEPRS